MEYRYFIHLAYNGRDFFGWQIQKNEISIQETINQALELYFKQKFNITGCGRTDTGVHARNFFANMNLGKSLSTSEIQGAVKRLNGILPLSIVIYNLIPVNPGSSARFDAIARTYEYHIILGKDPFYSQLAYIVFRELDIVKMNQAAKLLLSVKVFTSFSKLHTQVNNNLCTLTQAEFKIDGRRIVFTITANRFLRNMVRAIVGTLLEVGLGKIEPEEVLRIADKKNRAYAGPSVPARGLYLTHVSYPKEIFPEHIGEGFQSIDRH